ncbi:hypothetical protein Ancab_004149 [Ancistrocladus abbreviatus]
MAWPRRQLLGSLLAGDVVGRNGVIGLEAGEVAMAATTGVVVPEPSSQETIEKDENGGVDMIRSEGSMKVG